MEIDYREEDEAQREWADARYQRNLMLHPDCNDPDHPGCDECCDDE